jgi:hypothetical protein
MNIFVSPICIYIFLNYGIVFTFILYALEYVLRKL